MENNYKDAIVIADICCNHMGDFSYAKKMIKEAKEHGVDIVKFQKRDIQTWVNRKPELYNAPHPNPINSFGKTYKEHREFLEFSIEQQKELRDYCKELGLLYSISAFDLESAKQIISIQPDVAKIPSASNMNYELIDYLCDNFDGEIHISFGMLNKEEVEKIIEYFCQKKRNEDLVIYACTSGYPVMPEDTCILEVADLKNKYNDKVKGIGFSGHHLNTAIDIGAYVLGAQYFERHFTLDRNLKGTDHKLSLLPDEFKKLKYDLADVKKSLTYKPDGLLAIEKKERTKLKW